MDLVPQRPQTRQCQHNDEMIMKGCFDVTLIRESQKKVTLEPSTTTIPSTMDTRTQRRFFSSTLFLIILTFLTAVHTDRSFCTDPTTPPRSILTRPVAFRHGEWYIQLHDKGRGTRWVKYCQIVDGDMWNVGVVGKAEGRLKELEMGVMMRSEEL